MGKLQYEGYSKEDAEKDASEQAAARGGNRHKLRSGKNNLRIVPARKGGQWKRVVYKHFVDISGGTAIFVCPKHETKGKRKCKTCERARKLGDSSDPTDEKLAKRLSAVRRVLVNVIDRADEESGPRILDLPAGIERDLTQLRNVDEIDYIDPINGHDILIIKTGEGRNKTRYKTKEGEQRRLHTSKAVMQDWIENAPDLFKFDRVEPDEVIEAILAGDDPREARRAAERRNKRRDDDDEDEEEEGLDVSKHGKSSKAKDEEEEDEDEDEDEEDEDSDDLEF